MSPPGDEAVERSITSKGKIRGYPKAGAIELAQLENNLVCKLESGIIVSIIGGIGSIPGAMLGGFFLGIVENLGIWKTQAGWKDTIAFAVMIVFLLFRPGGIFNVKAESERV